MFEIRTVEPGTVALCGRLDESASEAAATALRDLPGPLTLDCSELEYISSAGISVIMMTYKRLHATGLAMTMVRLQPRVRNVFNYAGLSSLLDIE